MAEGDSYGCKTYFLISFEGIMFLLQFVSRVTFISVSFSKYVDFSIPLKCFFGFDG